MNPRRLEITRTISLYSRTRRIPNQYTPTRFPQPSNGNCFSCNNFGHRGIKYRSKMSYNSFRSSIPPPFNGQCYACKKIGNKANECKSRIIRNSFMNTDNVINSQSFNGCCYTWKNFGHKAIECRFGVKRNGNGLQHGLFLL